MRLHLDKELSFQAIGMKSGIANVRFQRGSSLLEWNPELQKSNVAFFKTFFFQADGFLRPGAWNALGPLKLMK